MDLCPFANTRFNFGHNLYAFSGIRRFDTFPVSNRIKIGIVGALGSDLTDGNSGIEDLCTVARPGTSSQRAPLFWNRRCTNSNLLSVTMSDAIIDGPREDGLFEIRDMFFGEQILAMKFKEVI